MKTYMAEITVETKNRLEIIDITSEVKSIVEKSGVRDGFVVIFEPHTTAAITINEDDPALFRDFLNVYTKIAPVDGAYEHNRKYAGIPGEQNAHAHIIASLIKPSVLVPVVNGKLLLGTWQRILFVELDGPRRRKVHVIIYY